MAIENVLERIATALETLVERGMILGASAAQAQDLQQAGAAPPDTTTQSTGVDEQGSRGKATGPITTGQDAPPETEAVVLDKDSLPWDERIHSGSCKRNQDGRWTKKRKVDPAVVVAVEAELRAQAAAMQPADTSPQTQTGPLDFATLQAEAHDVVRALGPRQPEVAVVLGQYGVASLSALQQSQYEPFLASIKALVTTGPQG